MTTVALVCWTGGTRRPPQLPRANPGGSTSGFPERAAIRMRGASRRDEPRTAEYFPPDPAAGKNATATPSFGVDFCRFASAPHPEPIGKALCGVSLFLQDRDGNRWSIGTPGGGKPWL